MKERRPEDQSSHHSGKKSDKSETPGKQSEFLGFVCFIFSHLVILQLKKLLQNTYHTHTHTHGARQPAEWVGEGKEHDGVGQSDRQWEMLERRRK